MLILSACLINGQAVLLNDLNEDSMALYDLPLDPFWRGKYKKRPYIPCGLSDTQITNLVPFLD